MYTKYGYNILAAQVADEMTSVHESVILADPNVLFNTLRNSVKRFVNELNTRRVSEQIRQVSCNELPEFC